MTVEFGGRADVISNGQRAMHLQKVDLAVRVSDLAATTSAYFRAISKGSTSEELREVKPQLVAFADLICNLQQSHENARTYRALIPSHLWQAKIAEIGDLTQLDAEITDLLVQIENNDYDKKTLTVSVERFERLSRAFQQVGREELDQLTERTTAEG